MQGTVHSKDGSVISGASVHWIARQKEDVEATPAWPGGDWGLLQRSRLETTSDAEGRFEFGAGLPEGSPYGSVVIAEHRRHHAAGLELGAESTEWPSPIALVLEPASGLHVRVQREDGSPAPGSIVFHAPGQVGSLESFLGHRAEVGPSGEVELPPFRGQQALWAELGELRSTTWIGSPSDAPVVLTLGASFTVGGTITFPDRHEWKAGYEGERRILLSGLSGGLWRPLARLRDVQEGPWGPLRVALAGSQRFRVRLEGVPITPIEKELTPPEPGSHQRIDFLAEKNEELYLFVEDTEQKPITTATAIAWWGPTEADPDRRHLTGASRPDGYLYLGTFPAGFVRAEVTAPGYGMVAVEEFVPTPEAILVTLPRAARVVGRCLQGGRPVRDFSVIFWRDGFVREHRQETFLGRDEGRFELDTLAPGDWSFQAASDSRPAGPVVTARVEADMESSIELHVGSALLGRGRVLDSLSGQPVTSALIQVYTASGLMRSFRWGQPVPVSQDGSFEIEAFSAGVNFLTIEAEGYGLNERSASSNEQGWVDWGEVRLHPTQPLELRLIGLEGGDPRRILATSVGSALLPSRAFELDGRLRYERVSPGEYRIVVRHPEGPFERIQIRLEPGEEWSFDIPVGGPKRLGVILRDPSGRPPPAIGSVIIAYQEERAYAFRGRIPDEGGFASFAGIQSDRVEVLVSGTDQRVIAQRDVALDGDETEVEIRIGGPATRVLVVDEDGAVLPGAWVRVRSRDGGTVHAADDTDSSGVAELFDLPTGPVLLDVSHASAGRRLGVPTEVTSDEIEFVLSASGTLELRIQDGDLPLAGVSVRMETSGGTTLSEVVHTNADGVCRFEAVGAGSVRLAGHRADCWPVVVERSIAEGEAVVVEAQMRRLGNVELTVRNPEGLPVTGLELRVQSIEFETDVTAWLEKGLVRAPTGLVTDGLGRLTLEGLPNGTYAWGPGGDSSALGTFLVAPGKSSLALHLPR